MSTDSMQQSRSPKRRKFLAVIDETEECERAVTYAAHRASHTDKALKLLYVIKSEEFQHWLGVEEIMRDEAMAEGRQRLEGFAESISKRLDFEPELELLEGDRADAIRELIAADPEIKLLVLAAAEGGDGPGPLVSSLAGRNGAFPIPVTVIPGHLSDADIEALT